MAFYHPTIGLHDSESNPHVTEIEIDLVDDRTHPQQLLALNKIY
jgi:hypothetical protein